MAMHVSMIARLIEAVFERNGICSHAQNVE